MDWLKNFLLTWTWKRVLAYAIAITIVAVFLMLLLGWSWVVSLISAISLGIIALFEKPVERYFEKREEKKRIKNQVP